MKLSFNQKIIYGAIILGVLFPAISFCIALLSLDLECSVSSLIKMHSIMPSIFLIDLAPFILPLVAYYVTKMVDARGESENEKIQKEKFSKIEKFVSELGKGNFNIECDLASSGDSIGIVLDTLKDNQNQEQQRAWERDGVANFSELIRDNSENITELAQKTIQEMVKYIDSNFGGFYVLDESIKNQVLILEGSYAYDFSVKEKQIFEIGEGLVGQCFKDKETIYIDNLPENYEYSIESGLGKSVPSVLIFIPIVANEICVGVLEIASFHDIKKYKIEFVEKLSESLAISINNVKSSKTNNELLEESQFMGQQLQAQEEELRQNAEELQATQEEIERKLEQTEKELKSERTKINAIIDTSKEGIILVSEIGKIEEFNPAFDEMFFNKKGNSTNANIKEVLKIEEEISHFLNANIGEEVEIEIDVDWYKISINKIELEGVILFSAFLQNISEKKHNLAVMEESLSEFQEFMTEQAEIQETLENEIENLKKS